MIRQVELVNDEKDLIVENDPQPWYIWTLGERMLDTHYPYGEKIIPIVANQTLNPPAYLNVSPLQLRTTPPITAMDGTHLAFVSHMVEQMDKRHLTCQFGMIMLVII